MRPGSKSALAFSAAGYSTPRAAYQHRGRPPLDIASGTGVVVVGPVESLSGRWVVNVGHRGGARNAELGPRREEVRFLAWRNEDLDPPLVPRVPRPRCRIDEEPPDFPGLWKIVYSSQDEFPEEGSFLRRM